MNGYMNLITLVCFIKLVQVTLACNDLEVVVTTMKSGTDNNLKVEPKVIVELTKECFFHVNACITVAKPFKTAKLTSWISYKFVAFLPGWLPDWLPQLPAWVPFNTDICTYLKPLNIPCPTITPGRYCTNATKPSDFPVLKVFLGAIADLTVDNAKILYDNKNENADTFDLNLKVTRKKQNKITQP